MQYPPFERQTTRLAILESEVRLQEVAIGRYNLLRQLDRAQRAIIESLALLDAGAPERKPSKSLKPLVARLWLFDKKDQRITFVEAGTRPHGLEHYRMLGPD